MAEDAESGDRKTSGKIRMGLLFVLGVSFLIVGVGNSIDVITWQPPAIVYFVGGFSLLAYGLSLLS